MIPFALLRPVLPYIGIVLALGGAWLYHNHAVSAAYQDGSDAKLAEWQASDKTAVAVGGETTRLLNRGAAAIEGGLNVQLKTLANRNAARERDVASLRIQLDELSAAAPSSDASCPAARSDGAERSCAELLSQGVGLVSECRGLVEESGAKLGALREWAELVQSANEQP